MNGAGAQLSRILTRSARRYLAGAGQSWVFKPPPPDWRLPRIERTSLYLHVPFCRSLCPYCPYTKVPYQQELVGPYTRAALAEVDWWAGAIGPAQVTSVYIGGGTPTLALGAVARVIERIRQRFQLEGDICIETNPEEVDAGVVMQLREAGVRMVSLGVQSFQAASLAQIGRRYSPAVAARALSVLAGSDFASVNADLMFALPGQRADQVEEDLAQAACLGANQLTAYPLFTFPYTSVGRYLRLKSVRMPNLRARWNHYHAINAWCRENGFERASVWSFKRGAVPRYSSVTRDGYIGIGPGAGSHLPDGFVLNTFDLKSWILAVQSGRGAIALRLPFTAAMSGWWWLYWRLYDTRIPLEGLEGVFGKEAARARRWLAALEHSGLAEQRNGLLELSEAGAFWLHLAQNHFALSYVNTVWSAARRVPWPDQVAI